MATLNQVVEVCLPPQEAYLLVRRLTEPVHQFVVNERTLPNYRLRES